MSDIDFDKFDLDGLSLEDIQADSPEEPNSSDKPSAKAEAVESIEAPETMPETNSEPVENIVMAEPEGSAEIVDLVEIESQAENDDSQMTCPKCELQQPKAEQCSGCGVYVEKALAQIGQSKIQITATKF